jgi:hypothetical protein
MPEAARTGAAEAIIPPTDGRKTARASIPILREARRGDEENLAGLEKSRRRNSLLIRVSRAIFKLPGLKAVVKK